MRKKLDSYSRCPGCGNFMINFAINKAMQELNLKPENVVFVSGIGCSGKMSHFVDTYAAETLHGRVLPFATGVKLSNEKLTVIGYSGDGDAYGIGLAHFIHTCDKDIDMTYIVADNQNYALTTGQSSPTTPLDSPIKHDTYAPLDPNKLAEISGCTFNEYVKDSDITALANTIKDAIQHKGFSHVRVDQHCPSWRKW